jgi:heme-degrading monooxygenase HmoA
MEEANNAPIFIDKFFVPANAKSEFIHRMNINRSFIKTLPGFIRDDVYVRHDEEQNLVCITIAVWESEEALAKAKLAVQAEYKREGFDPAAMIERLNIKMDRAVYKKLEN